MCAYYQGAQELAVALVIPWLQGCKCVFKHMLAFWCSLSPSATISCYLAAFQDVNQGDNELRTPLHYAAGFNHGDVASLLLKEGASLAAKDSKGNTPLHYAAGERGGSPAPWTCTCRSACIVSRLQRHPLCSW
jgi:hypothetical protein